ncbi:MAG: hypothetical protein AB7E95_14615, partial [Kiritimatiellales bacterium]
MKKKQVMIIGLCAVATLLFGAVVAEKAALDSKTVSSWADIYELYQARTVTPPLPDLTDPLSVYGRMKSGDWSFMNANWFRVEPGGTLYVSEKSKELAGLKLPLTVRVYDYLPSGETYILSSADGKNFQSEAAFRSEPLTVEGFEMRTEREQSCELFFGLWRRRLVWEVTLKAESDRWAELLSLKSVVTVQPVVMKTMSLSGPVGFQVMQDGTNLSVNLPDAFVGATITLKRSTNLIEGAWSTVCTQTVTNSGIQFLAAAEVPDPAGGTSSNSYSGGSIPVPGGEDGGGSGGSGSFFGAPAYYRSYAVSTVDSDGDGLDNVTEYDLGTDYLTADSDGDGLSDGTELNQRADPLNDDASAPEVVLFAPAGG